jgi:transposase
MTVHLRYAIRRVHCLACRRVKTEQVPWADASCNFTHAFEERVAYLAQQSSRTAVSELLRVAWRTVGAIIGRVVHQRLDAGEDRLDGLRHIGIDELSYRRHHEYITVVVDHERGVVVCLEELAEANKLIYRGYLLKESFAAILDRRQINVARANLRQWITDATGSGLAHFVQVADTVEKHLDGILEYVRTRFSNGRTEGINGKIRTITRRSFGFHSAGALISMIFLCCGGVEVSPAFSTPGFH